LSQSFLIQLSDPCLPRHSKLYLAAVALSASHRAQKGPPGLVPFLTCTFVYIFFAVVFIHLLFFSMPTNLDPIGLFFSPPFFAQLNFFFPYTVSPQGKTLFAHSISL